MKAKFSIGELLGVGFTIIVLGIGIAYGLEVMSDVQDDMTSNSLEYNATRSGMTGVAKIPEKIPMIVTVVIASTIIGILLTYLWGRIAGRV